MAYKAKIADRSIGEKYKKERLKQGLTLERISADTRIRKDYLEAIENDDFKRFDSPVYAKGFLKNYANYLGLNSESLISMYRRDYQNANMLTHKVPEKEKSKQEKEEISKKKKFLKLNITSKQLKVSITVVIIILAVVFIAKLIEQAFKPPYLKITSPIEITGSGEKTIDFKNKNLIIKGETAPYTLIKINEETVPLKPGFIFESDSIPITTERNVYIITAISQIGIKSEIKLEVLKSNIKKDNEAPIDAVINIVNDSAFVLVRADGIIKYNDQAYPNDAFPITAQKTLEIETSKPQNVKVTINGQEYTLSKNIETFQLKDGNIER